MDASACRVVYIDDRFNTERCITRESLFPPTTPQRKVSGDIDGLPPDLQANIHAVLSVFSQGMTNSRYISPTLTLRFLIPALLWYATADLPSLQFLYATLADRSPSNSRNCTTQSRVTAPP